MTVAELIEALKLLPPNNIVKIFNGDSGEFEPVTGMVYGGGTDTVELQSDDTD